MNRMLKSMSRLNIAAPSEAFNTVWYVEKIALAALSMNVSMSAGSTASAMSSSEVRIMVSRTWWTCSQMAFACEFSLVVGLHFMAYELHNVSKCYLNSVPLSYIKYLHLGYLHNQILLTNWLIQSDDLSKISSSSILSLPLTFLVINQVINGSSTILNQLELGSIMVRAMKSIDKPSLPFMCTGRQGQHTKPRSAYYDFRWEMSIRPCTSFVHLTSLVWLCYGLNGVSHSFPVCHSFHCLFKTGMSGVLKIVVIPHGCTPL